MDKQAEIERLETALKREKLDHGDSKREWGRVAADHHKLVKQQENLLRQHEAMKEQYKEEIIRVYREHERELLVLRKKNRALEGALQNSSPADLKEISERLRVLEAQVAEDRSKEARISTLVAKVQQQCRYAWEQVVKTNTELAHQHFDELQAVISELQQDRISDQKTLQTIRQCFSSTPVTTPLIAVPVLNAPEFQKEPVAVGELAFTVSTGIQTGSTEQSSEDIAADIPVSRQSAQQSEEPVRAPKKLRRLRRYTAPQADMPADDEGPSTQPQESEDVIEVSDDTTSEPDIVIKRPKRNPLCYGCQNSSAKCALQLCSVHYTCQRHLLSHRLLFTLISCGLGWEDRMVVFGSYNYAAPPPITFCPICNLDKTHFAAKRREVIRDLQYAWQEYAETAMPVYFSQLAQQKLLMTKRK